MNIRIAMFFSRACNHECWKPVPISFSIKILSTNELNEHWTICEMRIRIFISDRKCVFTLFPQCSVHVPMRIPYAMYLHDSTIKVRIAVGIFFSRTNLGIRVKTPQQYSRIRRPAVVSNQNIFGSRVDITRFCNSTFNDECFRLRQMKINSINHFEWKKMCSTTVSKIEYLQVRKVHLWGNR